MLGDGGFIHVAGIEITDLLLDAAVGMVTRGGLFADFLDRQLGFVLEQN